MVITGQYSGDYMYLLIISLFDTGNGISGL